jgi:hypothetical protein
MSKMKKYFVFLGVTCLFLACSTNPFTGKKNLNFVSNSELFPSAFQQYGEFLKTNKVVTGYNRCQTSRIGWNQNQKCRRALVESQWTRAIFRRLPMGIQIGGKSRCECLVYAWWKNRSLHRNPYRLLKTKLV